MSNKVHCGIAIPQIFPTGAIDPAAIQQFLSRAEALGYGSAWTQETILSKFAILEPVTLLSFAAAATSTMRLGVSVLLTTLRNPVQLAKALSSLDQLSGGRLDAGVGTGGHVAESLFGHGEGPRIRRFVEGIELMKAFWSDGDADVEGTFWNIKGEGMEPKPVQRPGPPIWFGARSEPAIRRAVKLGDAWMGAGSSSNQDFFEQIEIVRRELDAADRDPASFKISKRIILAIDDDRERAERRIREWFGLRYGNEDMGSRNPIWGSAEECVDQIAAVIEAGAEHLLLNPVFDEAEHLERLASDVIPALPARASQ